MKFEIHRDKDDDFIMLKNDSRCCICIYKDCSPDDFDAERTCRMIEKAPEIEELTLKLFELTDPRQSGPYYMFSPIRLAPRPHI